MSETSFDFDAAARSVRALLLDVDGVLSDGGIVYGAECGEIKRFCVRDGLAVKAWQHFGRPVGILSGRTSPVTDVRGRELGIEPIVQGHPDKRAAFAGILEDWGVSAAETCYVGDDLPDLPLLRACGIGAAPCDAEPAAKAAADVVLETRGGHGAVRELIERLLTATGQWSEILAKYEG